MNENVKKGLIIGVAVIAVIVAAWQGFRTMAGPVETKHEIGHGIPGHGMKAQENEEAAGKAGASKDGG